MKNKKSNPLVRIWRLGKKHHPMLIASIILSVVGVVIGITPYYCAAMIIKMIMEESLTNELLLIHLGIGLGGSIIKILLVEASTSLSHKATFAILAETRRDCLKKMSKLSIGTLQSESIGRWKTIIVDQLDSAETTLAHVFPEVSGNIAGSLTLIILLFFIDWRIALLALVVIPFGMCFMMGAMKGYAANYNKAISIGKEMNDAIVEYTGGIKVIKAFNQGEKSYERYSKSIKNNAQFYCNWMKQCMIPTSISRNISPAVLLTVIPFGLLFFINGSITGINLMIIIMLSMSIVSPILKIVNYTDTLATSNTIIESIETILNAKEQNHPEKYIDIKDLSIHLDDVHFAYNTVSQEALKGISLTISPKTKTALVGPSGSGKSTIAKLIAGFWDVEKGKILLGNNNLNDIPLNQISENISYVAQDSFLFDDTVMNNIRMGKENAIDEEVIRMAKESGCHDFIMALENGYDTIVGGKGSHLSGGECQRISIARAMLKNAPIVILDEATAYIDPENEAIIQAAINKLIKDKTLIVIAHRLSTITDADQIVVFKEGHVMSTGSHQELLESCELYQKMWAAHISVKEEA